MYSSFPFGCQLIVSTQLIRQSRDTQSFILPLSWEKALSSIVSDYQGDLTHTSTPICLVKGPKKSGKSTFARTLLNCLSTKQVLSLSPLLLTLIFCCCHI